MLFTPLQKDSGKTKELFVTFGSTVTKGDPLAFSSGYVALATNSEVTAVRFVALETDTGTVTGGTDVLSIDVRGVEFQATTQEETAQSQIGTVCDLNATGEVENEFATGNIFCITEIVGVAADKTVRGYFLDRVNA